MESYEKIKQLIDSSKLKLHFVFSVPRTRSHAINFALTQAHEIDGQLDVPWNNANYPPKHSFYFDEEPIPGKEVRFFEEGCKNILERMDELLEANSKLPVVLLIHEHISHILKNEIPLLLELTDNVVLTMV